MVPNDTEPPSRTRIRSIGEVFKIVGLSETHNCATVTEVTAGLPIPHSTCTCNRCTERGLSFRDGTEYRIGLHFHQHGRYARHQFVICDAAKREIDKLVDDRKGCVTRCREERVLHREQRQKEEIGGRRPSQWTQRNRPASASPCPV